MKKVLLSSVAICLAMGMNVFAAEQNYPKFTPFMSYK